VKPEVTILVTTRNEERNIAECLKAARNQDEVALELLVVDNFSSDRTAEIARDMGARVSFKGPERSAQRNLGLAEAKGDYVFFLDADMRPDRGVAAEALHLCRTRGHVGLYVPERVAGKGWWGKVRNFERSFYDGTVIDAVRFLHRETALALGGFDESLNGPEDWDFDRRMRATGSVAVTRAGLVHDEGDFSLRRYLAKKRYYSRGFDAYISKWGRRDPEIRKQFGAGYRFLGVFVEEGKWRKLLAHPGLASGMYFLRAAVGLSCLGRILRGGRS